MFFNVKTTEEVLEIIQGFNPAEEESIDLSNASGRVLSRDMISPEDLPGFPRSSMDGFAVRAKDTFGASESLPALLELKGEVLMGQIPAVSVEPGTAIRISTGGMVPEGADAVVIIEHCHLLDETTLEVMRAASPQEHIIRPGDDFARGAAVLKKGWTLRPQDVGVMDKEVLRAVPWSNETVPLLVAEPFDCAFWHLNIHLLSCVLKYTRPQSLLKPHGLRD